MLSRRESMVMQSSMSEAEVRELEEFFLKKKNYSPLALALREAHKILKGFYPSDTVLSIMVDEHLRILQQTENELRCMR